MKNFADRLREARAAAGLTQEQLGFALGVTKSSVSAWENGRETPSFRLLATLRNELKCSLDDLICGDAQNVREEPGSYTADKASHASTRAEHALLTRFRNLSLRRRDALLELMKPDP
jgi:transcriptional regulator with XRE-family HTH domain